MKKPHIFAAAFIALALLAVAACSGPPETQVYIVVTSTHEPPTLTALALGGTVLPSELPTEPPVTPGTATISALSTPIASAIPLPTPLVAQIQVAEQLFEHGRMFWLQPNLEIWVMVNAEGATDHGTWWIFQDTFIEGEVEIDPEITPPADLIQPRRGFGKLWREHPEVREAVGWGTTSEYGFVTTYEYRAGGYLNSDGQYVPGPGTHLLTSLGNETFAFEESDMTWRLVE